MPHAAILSNRITFDTMKATAVVNPALTALMTALLIGGYGILSSKCPTAAPCPTLPKVLQKDDIVDALIAVVDRMEHNPQTGPSLAASSVSSSSPLTFAMSASLPAHFLYSASRAAAADASQHSYARNLLTLVMSELQKPFPRPLDSEGRIYDPFVMSVSCPAMEKVGNDVDGGKWTCGARNLNQANCLVYSFGSRDDFSFEGGVLALSPTCEIHTFDPTLDKAPQNKPRVVHFHSVGVGAVDGAASHNGRNFSAKSYASILRMLGHDGRVADILKIDVEGYEFGVMQSIVKEVPRTLWPRQVLMEIHVWRGTVERPLAKLFELFKLMECAGYRAFSREPNMNDPA